MHDPTRIDRTLAALRDAWEGQPDLPLGTLFGILATEGYGWGADDAALTQRLLAMAAVHPPALPLGDAHLTRGRWLLITEEQRVTLAEDVVVTRPRDATSSRQPVVWRPSAIRPVGPGRPLVIADTEGFEHRLGVVERITRLRDDTRSISGVRRRSVGDRCWIIRTDTETIVLDHGLHAYTRKNRAVTRADYAWQRIEACELGMPLRVALSRGTVHEFGTVIEVILAESAPFNVDSAPMGAAPTDG